MGKTSLFHPDNRTRADAESHEFYSPEELEFYAEHETIKIVPNFSMNDGDSTLHCIEGSYGPFKPNMPVEVPIWVALALLKRNYCRVIPPEWMSIANLSAVLEEEKNIATSFQPLPYYYIEIAQLLFRGALIAFGDDSQEVRSLVESIRRVRYHKIETGLKSMKSRVTAKLNHLSATEINTMRRLFTGVLDMFYELSKGGPSDLANSEDRLTNSL